MKDLRKLFIIGGIGIIIVILVGIVVVIMNKRNQPNLFTLNDPNAIYKVVKGEKCRNEIPEAYCIEKEGGSGSFTLAVGKSNVGLDLFVDKEVLLEGNVHFSDEQCIQDKCIFLMKGKKGEFENTTYVVDIEKIQLKK